MEDESSGTRTIAIVLSIMALVVVVVATYAVLALRNAAHNMRAADPVASASIDSYVLGSEDPGLPSASPSLASPSPSPSPSPTPRRSTATKPSHKPVAMAKPPKQPAPPASCPVTHTGTAAPRSEVKSALVDAAALRAWQETAPEISAPLSLVEAVAWQESGWQSNVVSCIGAVGVMQLVPTTADWMNQRFFGEARYDLSDLDGNAALGSLQLQWLIKYFGDVYFGSNYALAPGTRNAPSLLDAVLAAYNVGYGNVDTTVTTATGKQSVLKIPNWGYVDNVEALMNSKPWNG